jgi:hypothetical protein
VTYTEILGRYHQIGHGWRTASVEQQTAAVGELGHLLAELGTEADGAVGDLRGRIEILMDEIEIRLGMDLPEIPGEREFSSRTGGEG